MDILDRLRESASQENEEFNQLVEASLKTLREAFDMFE